MCILCVASRWSRRIGAMLPWLVIPLTVVWVFSHLLPPGFQFEVTSPRVACVVVLFMSLIWYEVVMPKLYAWRARQRDVLRERRRIEAQEVAKWRKEATRRCRNCFTAYKDQTPGGGKFMCTYCGHASKRPVLDVPGGAPNAGSSFSLAGVAAGFITGGGLFSPRSSKMWNVRGSRERPIGGRGWMGGRPWIDGGSWGVNGSWFGGSWPGSAPYYGSAESGWAGVGAFTDTGVFGGERCSAGESYFGAFWLVLKVVSHLLFFVGWIFRKLWRAGFSGEHGMGRARRACHSVGEDVSPSPETRSEKARRKAEEKRIARLEKEQLEAEERKQREEVARLVEERRRQRDEKLEAEKVSEKEATAEKEREIKREKEAEKRRQEKSREKVQTKERLKDQEMEEVRKRKVKENEKKIDTDKSKGEDLKGSSIYTFESDKLPKGTKLETLSKGNEGGVSIATNGSSKLGSSKELGSAKVASFPQSKDVAGSTNRATSFWGRSFSTGSKHLGQSSKTVISDASSVPSTSSSNTASNGKPCKVSGSAWNRIHWANVWGKAGNKVPDDTSRKLEVVESADKISEASGAKSVKCLVDGDIVLPSTGGVLQQPIAPPSSLPDSRDNLFSGPIGFPPVQLPVDSAYQEQRTGKRIHQVPYAASSTSLLSTQSYFGSSTSVPYPGTQVLTSCTCPDAIDLATPASLPSSVSSSMNMIDFTGAEIDDPLSLDPLSAPLMSSSPHDHGTCLSPLSSLNISSTLPEGLDFGSAKQVGLFQTLEPWNVPPGSFLSDNVVNCNTTEGLWHCWPTPSHFSQPSLWDAPCQQGIDHLQPFYPTSLERNLELEPHVPSRIFSTEHKDGIPGQLYGENSFSMPSNLCLDSPGVESIMHVWEDADMNQKVPPEFVDCITHSLMQDPVITADGHSYERSAIEAWLKFHDTSPKTGEILPPPPGGKGVGVDKTLRPNHILRGQIIEYTERIARWSGPNEMNPVWNMTAAGLNSVAWSERSAMVSPPIRGFYPTPGVESFWSYNSCGS